MTHSRVSILDAPFGIIVVDRVHSLSIMMESYTKSASLSLDDDLHTEREQGRIGWMAKGINQSDATPNERPNANPTPDDFSILKGGRKRARVREAIIYQGWYVTEILI